MSRGPEGALTGPATGCYNRRHLEQQFMTPSLLDPDINANPNRRRR
jgi:hypothetical protein